MQLRLQGAYLHYFPELRAHIEGLLERALGRFNEPVSRATVRLSGGMQWRCQVRLSIPGLGRIAAQAARPLPSEAIDGALERLAPKLRRAMAGQQHFRRGSINKKGLLP